MVHRAIIYILLILATTHCVESIFAGNISFINLQKYASGTEKMPFQGRIALMPIGRWAETSHVMLHGEDWFGRRVFNGINRPLEPFGPDKIAYLLIGLAATLAAVGFCTFFGNRFLPAIWWLPAFLFIYMLYVTYAARSEQHLWYPYDLPQFAIFGIASVCLLQGWLLAALCLFFIDLPVRETAVFLIPMAVAVTYSRRQRSQMVVAIAMAVPWLLVRMAISKHFAHYPSDARIHWEFWARVFTNPYRWAQLASAFGFLLIPFIWGWKYLNKVEKCFVFGAIPGFALTALFGIWYETRVWDEWIMPLAILISLQIARKLQAQRDVPFTSDDMKLAA